ncbi:MAG: RNA polymerase sigma factor [Deltaproteobacteria bacterium]|nr:RNA polymerase sigma factor [Deltaproteobacteria bacterium]
MPEAAGDADALLDKARLGDAGAFDALVAEERPRLLRVVRRFLGHAEDTEDVVQESLLRAYERVGQVRTPAALRGWLTKIAVHGALDHLRQKKRWRADGQVHVRDHLHRTPEAEAASAARFASAEHRFDAREHIAFCFTCVARSLPPDAQAVLILRDVLGHTSMEAAKVLEVNEAKLRHTLTDARNAMQHRFDGLCGIVSKDGVCYQCAGLRNIARPGAEGPPVPDLGGDDAPRRDRWRHRLRVVQGAEIHTGVAQAFHDHVWRAMRDLEA